MSTATAAWAILRRDFLVELSYRMRFVAQLLSALFSLALFYYLSRLVRVGFQSPQDYFEFAVIGIVILQVLNSTLLLPPGVLRQELVGGTWERLVVSPFGAAKSVLAFMLYPFARACVIGCATLGLAAVLFHLTLAGPQAFLAIPVGIVATLAFAPFGIFVVAGVMIAKQV